MSELLDISALIKAHNMGPDEVILFPPKELREKGPAYFNIIRFKDGRFFKVSLFKVAIGAPRLRFELTKITRKEAKAGKRDDKNNPRVYTFLEPVPVRTGGDTPNYRAAFYFEGLIYSVRLWVRAYGKQKVLHLKLTNRPVEENA
jgi:hypothetical protein